MTKTYPTVERIRELFSYDAETGNLLYLIAPYHKPHMLGTAAGYIQKRDNLAYVSVDGKAYSLRHIISLHRTGELPKSYHHMELTAERLREALRYDEATGEFFRVAPGHGIKVGTRADYKEPNGYRYVNIDGTRHLAARLAWLYVHGEWPKRMLRFQDGNEQNCAISNLAYGQYDFSDPEQKRAYDKKHRKAKPEAYRKSQLKRDFGITLEQYEDALVAQGGVCAICQNHETHERNGQRKKLAVDHDHADGAFRGLLCASCNHMLGQAKDSPARLRKAADYLEAHAAKPKTNIISLIGRRISGTKD